MNNRIIKFRAWDDLTKRMVYDVMYVEQRDGYKASVVSQPMCCRITEYMQYTGLKDKNNKEIYEGDILKTDSGATKYVKYREDMAQFVCSFEKGASTNIQKSDEVIGNIYEHKDLIPK